MPYSLRRTRDNAGDSGQMSLALVPVYDEGKIVDVKEEEPGIPRVGVAMRVGSHYGRSYSAQDWWQTTIITEILSDTTDEDIRTIQFKTGNSEYEWRHF